MDLRIGLRTTTYCENLQANFQNHSYVICTGALVTRIHIYRRLSADSCGVALNHFNDFLQHQFFFNTAQNPSIYSFKYLLAVDKV